MNFFKYIYSAVIGIFGIVNSAHSAVNPSESSKIVEEMDGKNLYDDCTRLLKLEEKIFLNSQEFEEGKLLHEMILQVSDSPIEYCAEVCNVSFTIVRPEQI